MAPDGIATIVHMLRWRAAEQPNGVAYVFLADGETETGRLTYEEVDRRARAVAQHLQARGAAGGDAVAVVAPGVSQLLCAAPFPFPLPFPMAAPTSA